MTYRKQRVFTQVELAAVSRRTCAAFTLVELLVVVSIIALLVTMLMPSLMEGVRHARKVKCKVNLREIPRACVVYALENRYNQGGISRSLPSTGLTGGWNSGARANRESLWKLVDLRMLSPESLVCPALDENQVDTFANGKPSGYAYLTMVGRTNPDSADNRDYRKKWPSINSLFFDGRRVAR